MRRLASFLLLGVALAAGAADIWRWKDADGVVHYSDSPVPGAERVNVVPPPRPGDAAPTTTVASSSPLPQAAATTSYVRCAVTQPSNDQVFVAADSVNASVAIEPALQPGHHVQIQLNGGVYPDWPEGATSYTLTGLYRGSYTLAVWVLDANDRKVCAGQAITFHVQQPSVLSPARQPPKKQ